VAKYLISRIAQAALVLWAAFTVAFILLQVLPGDAVMIKFESPDLGLSASQIAEIRSAYAVDQPLIVQYGKALGNTLTGQLGYSIQQGVTVGELLRTNLPPTLRLASLGFVLAVTLAVGIAFLANLTPFGWLRAGLQAVPALFVSVPVFWLGIVLIQVISFRLRWVSVIAPGEIEGLILPTITLAVPISAPLAQVLLRSIDAVQTQNFVSVARAKGASAAHVLWAHVARNAILPVLTIAGVLLGELLAGAVVTETVFGLNGLGSMTRDAVSSQDVSVLQALVVLSAAVFVVVNLAVDLLYPVLDPRLRRRFEVGP
jgi:peptide/nickel transport system permease protein